MNKIQCTSCQSTKTTYQCSLCQEHLCKSCVQFNDPTEFSFLPTLSKNLSGETYCQSCYGAHVLPEINAYNELMEKAKEVQVFSKKQLGETRYLSRKEPPIKVADCDDYDETVLRLAFLAAQRGFNGIIDMVVTSAKVKIGGYQTTKWTGTAIPANINEDKLIKDRSHWQNPN